MRKVPLSPIATALIRALHARSGVERERIILVECISRDWQSLTFTGERHEISLRVAPPDARAAVESLLADLEEADFPLPGHFLADIAHVGLARPCPDGSILIDIEALTVRDG